MGFRDRGRYKFLATAVHATLPELQPELRAFPEAKNVPGFPSEAVVLNPDHATMQLVWIEDGFWSTWFFATGADGEPRPGALHSSGPRADDPQRTAGVRWALSHTQMFYESELRARGGAQADSEPVDLGRLFYQDMAERVGRVAAS